MKEYEQKINNIINKAKEDVIYQANQAYQNGYIDGYADGKADTHFTDTEEAEKKAYDRGLSDAWELVKRIESTPKDGGLTNKQIVEVFGQYWSSFELYGAFSVGEAMDLMKAYEDKQKQDAEIKVGDEVEFDINLDNNNKGIVTRIIDTRINKKGVVNAYVLWNDGSCGLHSGTVLKKTGHTHTQIAEVLAELRGAENDE